MSRIMCTQKLWRALRQDGYPPINPAEPLDQGPLLGSWALTSLHFNRQGLVLALEERTYLTLIFPLAPPEDLRVRFAEALRHALFDLGVPPAHVDREVRSIDFLPLARLTKRTMAGSLNQLVFLARCELDYLNDLRRVQWNLNDVPHVRRDPPVPKDAVTHLFGTLMAPTADERVH